MATANILKTQLRLILENGTHPTSGKPVYKTKSFNNIVTSSTATQLLTVGTALSALQELPLYEVNRADTSMIEEA